MHCRIRNKQSFDNIITCKKTFEGRLYRGIWESVQVNDILIFEHDNEECSKVIKKITLYHNITDFCEERQILDYKLLFDTCYSEKHQKKYKVIILDI